MSYRYFYLAFTLIFLFFSCQQSKKQQDTLPPNTFKVSGKIENLDTKVMFFDGRDASGNRVWDTIKVDHGFFEYTGKTFAPSQVKIWPRIERIEKRPNKRSSIATPSNKFKFFVSDGAIVKFDGKITDFVEAYPSGTTINEELASLNKVLYPLQNKLANFKVLRAKSNEAEQKQQLTDSIANVEAIILNNTIDFIKQNPTSELSAFLVNDLNAKSLISKEEIATLFKELDGEALKTSTFYQSLNTRVIALKSVVVGNMAPAVISTDLITGSKFNLNDLRGKMVLLDFWGTWCGPCVSEMPRLKKYHEQYKNQLAIVGVNQGDRLKKVRKFVNDHNYNWHHIPAKDSLKNLVDVFNVTIFPTKVLLDEKGKIIYHKSGVGDDAFKLIERTLSNKSNTH
ncbi:TlpA disulfide reductase family protein [Aureibaculum sp. 2210JD6-5]|uniref:TlpA family protein disulfide reductase n=1 Tax=Aureibaculum sp. 2210JD6-5 TaxID=3103957 RepID=UPI002AAE8879|nr:TlpA disulfide reductase family protein [Aureibaculum sp. 2210JD6-5]MDY7396758.1 TlpA disulfide reductase family protein [Aureibaculum sp. 2210JD6-5]